MKNTTEKTNFALPEDQVLIRSTLISAKIEGIEINETQLQNAFERFREAILRNLKRNQAIPD